MKLLSILRQLDRLIEIAHLNGHSDVIEQMKTAREALKVAAKAKHPEWFQGGKP